ncbi:MAG: hypothetical protein C0399_03685 [Syntrophus sp. (in: bacteria)]|nr:hypothetical protein [Syntrophus sp. (in: bacteria)]
MDSWSISEKRGGFEVYAQVNIMGDDLLVVLSGGKIHIGAIAMAQPRPSLDDPKKISATSSVYTYVGHKEDVIVKSISEELSKELNRKAVVVAGIHWDKLALSDIKVITGICSRLTKRIIKEVGKR